jgi:ABC-type sugar transport system, ATPase component
LKERHQQNLGLVSLDIPLISNLNAWLNIALIRLYHFNEGSMRTRKRTLELLNRFQKIEIADLRIAALDQWELFLVKLLRAAMVQDALIVIDRPFRLVPDLPDAEMIQDSLDRIDEFYESCQIYDYVWNRDRYQIDDVQES